MVPQTVYIVTGWMQCCCELGGKIDHVALSSRTPPPPPFRVLIPKMSRESICLSIWKHFILCNACIMWTVRISLFWDELCKETVILPYVVRCGDQVGWRGICVTSQSHRWDPQEVRDRLSFFQSQLLTQAFSVDGGLSASVLLHLVTFSPVYRIAVCINGPKRFAVNAQQLLGKETIKQRHLRLLGYEVVEVSLFCFFVPPPQLWMFGDILFWWVFELHRLYSYKILLFSPSNRFHIMSLRSSKAKEK